MSGPTGADDTSAFGMPGNEGDVERTIEVAQFDTYRFEPASISVSEGETIMFDVSNQGSAVHEFVIGDDSFQDEHEAEMADMGGMAMVDEPNAITIQPGESKTLVWTFSQAGSFLYGCHVAGHYAAGMRGSIDVGN
ncbi:MAG: plastocyanin/azurin family copper-binding protein [Actinomycetota bacterium]